MRMRLVKVLSFVAVLALVVAVPSLAASAKGTGTSAPKRSIAKVGPKDGGGEPSIATGPEGNLYVSYPAGSGPTFFRSTNNGGKWVKGAYADSQSGDTSVNVDAGGSVYQGNLNVITGDQNTLQADVYKSTDFGGHWTLGQGPIVPTNTTNNPLLVDRPW